MAKDKGKGKELSNYIIGTSTLTKEMGEQILKEAEHHSVSGKQKGEKIELKNNSYFLCYHCENKIYS